MNTKIVLLVIGLVAGIVLAFQKGEDKGVDLTTLEVIRDGKGNKMKVTKTFTYPKDYQTP